MKVTFHPSWNAVIGPELEKAYFQEILHFIAEQKRLGKEVYPAEEDIFSAFRYTDFNQLKVVLLGQDPYHQPEQANGLAFSVKSTQPIPPSLRNIFAELWEDVHDKPAHGDLSNWARQGVLLLNSILTVNRSEPGSHQNSGWEQFTDAILKGLSLQKTHLVFLLWGNYARKKKHLIDSEKHLILEAAHPSPLSVKGFKGCRHFSKTNQWLVAHQLTPIQWNNGR